MNTSVDAAEHLLFVTLLQLIVMKRSGRGGLDHGRRFVSSGGTVIAVSVDRSACAETNCALQSLNASRYDSELLAFSRFVMQ